MLDYSCRASSRRHKGAAEPAKWRHCCTEEDPSRSDVLSKAIKGDSLFLFGFDMLTMHSIERKKDDVCNTIT